MTAWLRANRVWIRQKVTVHAPLLTVRSNLTSHQLPSVGCLSPLATSVRNLGVTMDSSLSFLPYVNYVFGSSCYQLRRIRNSIKALQFDMAKTVVNRIDYCNSFLTGMPHLSIVCSMWWMLLRGCFVVQKNTRTSALIHDCIGCLYRSASVSNCLWRCTKWYMSRHLNIYPNCVNVPVWKVALGRLLVVMLQFSGPEQSSANVHLSLQCWAGGMEPSTVRNSLSVDNFKTALGDISFCCYLTYCVLNFYCYVHCFSLVMYGAFESVAVLWRLRSHRYIIIIIIIIITTLLTSKLTHNTDWIEYRFLSTRGQRQRKTQGEDAHVHKVDGLPAAAAARDQQKINENELKEKSMSIRNPKSLSVREGSLMGSSSIQRWEALRDLSGSMRTLWRQTLFHSRLKTHLFYKSFPP